MTFGDNETIKARVTHGGSQRTTSSVVSARTTGYYTAVTLSAVNRRSGRTTERNPPMATRISNTTPPGIQPSAVPAPSGSLADFDYSNFYYSSSDDIFA